jgi:hypothetical protein
MPLTRLVQECGTQACPCVYEETDDGEIVVQGDVVAQPLGVDLASGEGLVRIPRAMFLEAAARLARSASG